MNAGPPSIVISVPRSPPLPPFRAPPLLYTNQVTYTAKNCPAVTTAQSLPFWIKIPADTNALCYKAASTASVRMFSHYG